MKSIFFSALVVLFVFISNESFSANRINLDSLASHTLEKVKDDPDQARNLLSQHLIESDRIGTNIAKGKHLKLKGEFYGASQNLDSSTYYLKRAYTIFKKEGDKKVLANTISRLQKNLHLQGEMDESWKLCNEFLALGQKLKDNEIVTDAYYRMATHHSLKGKYDVALKYTYKSLDAWKKLDKEGQAKSTPYAMIAIIHSQMGEYEKAIKPMEDLVKNYVKVKNYWGACQWSNNMGVLYLQIKNDTLKYKKTLWKSIQYGTMDDFHYGVANASNQLASLYSSVGELDSAKFYLNKIDEVVPNNEEPDFKASVDVTKAQYYRFVGKPTQAIHFYQEAILYWEKQNDFHQLAKYMPEMIRLQEKIGDYKNAYLSQIKQAAYKDSIFDKTKIENLKQSELEYGFKTERLQDSLQTANLQEVTKIQNQKKQSRLVYGLLLLGLAIAFITFAWVRKRKQATILDEKNNVIEASLVEKQLLLKEVHHRVKNNFQIVSSLLELQSKDIEDEKAKALAKEGQNRVKSMAFIHQKLYQNDDLLIYFDDYISKLVKEISAMYGDSEVKASINTSSKAFDIDTAIPLGLIVNELVTNAYKYGFGKDKKTLDINLKETNEGYELSVTDNGEGLPEGFDFAKAKSLGLRLVRRLSKQLQGSVSYSNVEGCSFSVFFKDTSARALTD